MKKLLTLILLIISIASTNAQHFGCGVNHQFDSEIKNRMIRNRSLYNTISTQSRSTIYIPVTIHIVGPTNGGPSANPSKTMEMLCRLNEDFANQNIYFFLDSIRFIANDFIHSDGYGWPQINAMASYKNPNTLNIFVNSIASQPVAGYYTPSQDFIFMLSPYANGSSTTITHEMGHFFTLPHTFYGWEGVNAPSLYSNTPAPVDINGQPVENVTRDNCLIAGDGFCDTDADYISYRFSCPIVSLVQDPNGVTINPDPEFYMSYSSDECMNKFSQEQQNAILADITNRNWLNFPAPSSTAMISSASISPVTPSIGSTISTNTGSTYRFEWDTTGASAATNWTFILERTVLGIPVEVTFQANIFGNNFADVPLSEFLSNRDYRWSVIPYSVGYTCAGSSSYFNFRTGTISGAETLDNSIFDLKVYPNPATSGSINIELNTDFNDQASLSILSADGRNIYIDSNIQINPGNNNYPLDIKSLNNGFYFIVIKSSKMTKTIKLVVQ